ncbi:MAG: hypothetical protein LUE87_06240 [Lachnospiraceae bacterium]|nr:hypothetical protein [Lachnospiraceae bacterium]
MINDLKLSVRLMKKSYQFKFSLVIMGVFFLVGIMEMATGAAVGGLFIFMAFTLFPYQLLSTLGYAGLAAASPFRRRMQVEFQVKVYLAGSMAGLILVSVFTAVMLLFADVEGKVKLWNIFLIYGVCCAVFGFYMTLAYKFFIASTAVMLSCVYLPLIMRPETLFEGIGNRQFFSAPVTVLITVGLILFSSLVQYGLGSLLYRLPLSKFAANWNLRRYI